MHQNSGKTTEKKSEPNREGKEESGEETATRFGLVVRGLGSTLWVL
ncbi:hypothetical protein A2U01_0080336, partial [Trifolium medium]|nr:hypothetical protein [Trifolium medium]